MVLILPTMLVWRPGLVGFVTLALALAGCAQGGAQEALDAGHGVADSGGSRDAGVTPQDAGTTPYDAGATPQDAGTAPHDAGTAPHDAGTAPHDAGTAPHDAGTGPTDSGLGHDAGPSPDSGTDAGSIADGGPTCAPAPGQLAIDEVMIASASGLGDRGEWFEVVNYGTCRVDLTGVIVESPTSAGAMKTATISAGTIAPGQHFVFALSGDAMDNHGLPVDYVYGVGGGADEVILNNGADSLTLTAGMTVLDTVSWPSGGFTYGHARQLPPAVDPSMNSSWSAWCDATSVYSTAGGSTFYGTPGTANTSCGTTF